MLLKLFPKIIWFFVVPSVMLLTITGCLPYYESSLEKTSKQLKAGMTKNEVMDILKDFKFSETKYDPEIKITRDSKKDTWFQTNALLASDLSYSPKEGHEEVTIEYLTVYFDKKDIIIGYNYAKSG